MPVNKRKKFSRMRGSHTHGGGAKKKRRGAGNRGGRGMAGSGKRADQKKPTIINEYGNNYFGRVGFNRPQKMQHYSKGINIGFINDHINNLLEKKLIKKEDDVYIIDLKKLGYEKLLGKGKVSIKMQIKASSFSKKAKEKIKASDGILEEENVK
ncbi:uL15 family ribosomal protein [Candidatus Woesearchaeota archaeon]|nr:uL15 family ribosomal protein [Candidatus Woesearchaeota archaeon]